MENVDLRRLLTPDKAILPYVERRDADGLSPYSVELHITSFCNYSCYHCSYKSRREAAMKLDEEHTEGLIKTLEKLSPKGVYWSGGGEPTTMKNLPDYISTLNASGIEQALVTNGVLIGEEMKLQLSKLNYIAVSFQASGKETYKAITGCDKRDQLYKTIKSIKGTISKTVLGARSVINRLNYREVGSMLKDARKLGFDYIIFIPAVDYEQNGRISLGESEKRYLTDLAVEIDGELDDKYTNLRAVIARQVSHYEKAPPPGFPCYSNSIRATAFINFDGGVWLCQPHIGKPKYCIGNLNESNLDDMWNGPRHMEVMEILDEEHRAGLCQSCRSIGYNKSINRFLKDGSGERIEDFFL